MYKYYISHQFKLNGIINNITVEVEKDCYQKALATKQRKIARAERII